MVIIIKFMIFTLTEETLRQRRQQQQHQSSVNHIYLQAKTNPNPVEFKFTSCFTVLNMHNPNTKLTTRYLRYWKPVNKGS